MEALQYPIGKYIEQPFSDKQLKEWLLDIQTLPMQLEYAINNLDEAQLQTAYRPGGWTVHQLVHHVADSHMNAYIRFKLGLSEDNPTIKPYEEKDWAEMADTKNLPVNISVTLLYSLHLRWHELLKNVTEAQWQRTVFHPESKKQMTLWYLLGMYAWHGMHHVAHIRKLREREGWGQT
ncbi:MAG: putative metal-dependent hydrolase [Ferruginibacter sp.]|nr:putative metal-dependent hydrolase [Ferruginibacter sp.]